jgi:Ca2+-binding EF-hand superfamily protein
MRYTLKTLFAATAIACNSSLPAQEEGDLFKKLDANADGFVAADEVSEEQKALFDRLIRKADKDSDKKLSKEEFQAGLKPDEAAKQPLGGPAPGGPGSGRDRPEAGELFDRLDANKDGKLSRDELRDDRREGFMRMLERVGGDSLTKEQFVRGMAMMAQAGGRPPGAPEGRRPDGPPPAGERDRRPEGRGMPGGPPGPPPFIAAIDTNRDGEFSKEEIEGASKALLALDKNNDGKLSREEIFPGGPPPGGPFGDRPREGRPGEGRPGDLRPGDPRPGDAGKGRPGDPRPGDAGKGRPPEGKAGGFSPEAFRDQLNRADKDGDGKLSKEEAPERLKENFDRLDANSDGFLDETERRQLFQRLLQGKTKRPEGKREEPKRDEQPK